eukprot:CAMPEP_0197670782 /NCGR_PEP_ID=MMETSP1338-20131121/75272_1 /TAXON_ID=43686 ORGANISM="Pelagodinium beii, Strain RCC1491" /NCGR_SAMPLE_ID=MMETSP1338 /ASSEMBLY_ACC=CAM_ASM_000754 /LENGTH=574 /DNA_ID=CAMNT_0043250567 /DNA_START=33 /DNA_END=1753 /DNA_ORIENTATION=+
MTGAHESEATPEEVDEQDELMANQHDEKPLYVLLDGMDLTGDPRYVYSKLYVACLFIWALAVSQNSYSIVQAKFDTGTLGKAEFFLAFFFFTMLCGFFWALVGLGNSKRLRSRWWQLLSALTATGIFCICLIHNVPLPDKAEAPVKYSLAFLCEVFRAFLYFTILTILGLRALGTESKHEYALLEPDEHGRWGVDDVESLRKEANVQNDYFEAENRSYLFSPGLPFNLKELFAPKPLHRRHSFPETERLRAIADSVDVALPVRVMSATILSSFLQAALLVAVLAYFAPKWLEEDKARQLTHDLVVSQLQRIPHDIISQFERLPPISGNETELEASLTNFEDYAVYHLTEAAVPIVQRACECVVVTALIAFPTSLWFLHVARMAFRATIIELIFSMPTSYHFSPDKHHWACDLRFVGTFSCSFASGSLLFYYIVFIIVFVLSSAEFWNWLWGARVAIIAYVVYECLTTWFSSVHSKLVANKENDLVHPRLHAILLFLWELINFPKASISAIENVVLVLFATLIYLMRPDVRLMPRGMDWLDFVHYTGPALQLEALKAADRYSKHLQNNLDTKTDT